MRYFRSIVLLGWVSAVGLASCASSSRPPRASGRPLPVPTAEATLAAGLSPERAQKGRRLYDSKCLRCHKSYDPHAYSAPQWDSWMTKMSRKAHLDTVQQDLLVRYLQAVRAAPITENH